MNSEFGGAWYRRGINCTSEDLPDPVAPTIATVLPLGIDNEIFRNVGAPLYEKLKFRNSMDPSTWKSLRTPGSSFTSAGASKM